MLLFFGTFRFSNFLLLRSLGQISRISLFISCLWLWRLWLLRRFGRCLFVEWTRSRLFNWFSSRFCSVLLCLFGTRFLFRGYWSWSSCFILRQFPRRWRFDMAINTFLRRDLLFWFTYVFLRWRLLRLLLDVALLRREHFLFVDRLSYFSFLTWYCVRLMRSNAFKKNLLPRTASDNSMIIFSLASGRADNDLLFFRWNALH